MEKRNCITCEYSRKARYHNSSKCHLNPPVLPRERPEGRFPDIYDGDFCSKWEPKWDDNPVIAEAWELFLVTLKLAK